MKSESDLSADLLERSIAQHEQRLANAQEINNTHLASRVQRDLERLLKQKKTGAPAKKSSRSKAAKRRTKGKRRAKGSRPKLKDESTIIEPHGRRWMELIGYVQELSEHFPTEHLADRCGLFSNERQFARYIRVIESRIAGKG